jgi:hypothetical protein
MAATFTAHVWDVDYKTRIDVSESEEGLVVEVTDEAGARNEAKLVLDDTNVRSLRLALTKYERGRKS